MFCPYCGNQAEEKSRFCSRCGAKLPDAAEASQRPQTIPETLPLQEVQPLPPTLPIDAPIAAQEQVAPQPLVSQEPVTPASEPMAPIPSQEPVIPQPIVRQTSPSFVQIPLEAQTPYPASYPQTPQKPPKAPRRKPSPRLLGIVAAALIALVAVAVILGSLNGGKDSWALKEDILPFYNPEEEATFFSANGKLLGVSADGDYRHFSSSCTGEAFAVEDEFGQLCVYDGKTLKPVTEEVDEWVLSRDGNALCYLDQDGALLLYTVKTGKKTTVASEDVKYFVLSPNGKEVLYNTWDEETLCYFDGKNTARLKDNAEPLALSDGGKYIYYRNTDNYGLYVTNPKGASSKLCSDIDREVYTNANGTQLLFCSGEKWFITVKGGDRVKIHSDSGYSFRPLLPDGSGKWVSLGNNSAQLLPVDTLAQHCYWDIGGDTVIYLNKKLEPTVISDDVNYVQLASDWETMVYSNYDGELYQANVLKPEKHTLLGEEVEEFLITPNGKGVYFLDSEDALWYTADGKAKQVADEVYTMTVAPDGRVFFLMDYSYDCGELYVSKNGEKRVKIASDVNDIGNSVLHTYVLRDYDEDAGTFDLYVILSGNKLTLVMAGVE